MSNASKIQAWRDTNPGKRITEQDLLELLGVGSLRDANLQDVNLQDATLWDADLTGANLTGANLIGADLMGADLRRANLMGAGLMAADLIGADLRDADLTEATLRGANLRSANLWGANLRGAILWDADLSPSTGVAQIANVYAYPATIQPTPDGWYTQVGCWYGPLDALHKIATSDDDEDWPDARGEERERRRPLLQAILGVFDAHAANHPDVIDQLNSKWGGQA